MSNPAINLWSAPMLSVCMCVFSDMLMCHSSFLMFAYNSSYPIIDPMHHDTYPSLHYRVRYPSLRHLKTVWSAVLWTEILFMGRSSDFFLYLPNFFSQGTNTIKRKTHSDPPPMLWARSFINTIQFKARREGVQLKLDVGVVSEWRRICI